MLTQPQCIVLGLRVEACSLGGQWPASHNSMGLGRECEGSAGCLPSLSVSFWGLKWRSVALEFRDQPHCHSLGLGSECDGAGAC
jgi:hypothetical protein